jgi:hypothetical protein
MYKTASKTDQRRSMFTGNKFLSFETGARRHLAASLFSRIAEPLRAIFDEARVQNIKRCLLEELDTMELLDLEQQLNTLTSPKENIDRAVSKWVEGIAARRNKVCR